MPFRIYMHKQWPFKICMRVTSAFPTTAASSVLCLVSARGSNRYFGYLGGYLWSSQVCPPEASSAEKLLLKKGWDAVQDTRRKKQFCFKMQMVSGWVKIIISYNASSIPPFSVMSPKCLARMPWMPLRLDLLQLLYRDEGQKASSSSLVLWLSHVPSFGLEVRKFKNEEAFLTMKNQITGLQWLFYLGALQRLILGMPLWATLISWTSKRTENWETCWIFYAVEYKQSMKPYFLDGWIVIPTGGGSHLAF